MPRFVLRANITNRRGDDARPALVQVSIAEDGKGCFFLFSENEEGVAIYDTWHETIAEAKQQAEAEFVLGPWVEP
jgi:hypothetical protein